MTDPPTMPSALDVARRMTGQDERPPAPRKLTKALREAPKRRPVKPKAAKSSSGGGVMAEYIARREAERAAAGKVKTTSISVPHPGAQRALGFEYEGAEKAIAKEGESLLTAHDAMEAARRLQRSTEVGACVLDGRKNEAGERWSVRAERSDTFGSYTSHFVMPEDVE